MIPSAMRKRMKRAVTWPPPARSTSSVIFTLGALLTFRLANGRCYIPTSGSSPFAAPTVERAGDLRFGSGGSTARTSPTMTKKQPIWPQISSPAATRYLYVYWDAPNAYWNTPIHKPRDTRGHDDRETTLALPVPLIP